MITIHSPGWDLRSPISIAVAGLFVLSVCGLLSPPVSAHAAGAPGAAESAGGLLVVPAALDTTAGYRWLAEPWPGQSVLAWDAGMVVTPDTLAWEPFGRQGMAVPYGPDLRGLASRGRFVLNDGVYDLDEPLFLTDGRLTAYLAAGRLEIESGRLLYRHPAAAARDSRGTYFLLAGLVVMTWVLLLNIRRRRRS